MLAKPELQSARLRLRGLVESDAQDLQRHADDEQVWRNMFEGFPRPYTLADAISWCTHGAHDAKMGYVWGIESDANIIGCVGVRQDEGWLRCNAEVGYWIGRNHWGNGVAPEALGLVMAWAESNLQDVTRIYAPIFSWNNASQSVVQKNGFVKEAILPKSAIKAGQIIDRVVWAKYR
jgi:[ribosomal protein S5]-alanine N-acetyltransferase